MDLNDPLGKKIGKKKIWFLTFCFEEQKLSPVENPSFTVACPLSLQRFSLLRCVCEVVCYSSPVLSASATALALPDLYRYASALFFSFLPFFFFVGHVCRRSGPLVDFRPCLCLSMLVLCLLSVSSVLPVADGSASMLCSFFSLSLSVALCC